MDYYEELLNFTAGGEPALYNCNCYDFYAGGIVVDVAGNNQYTENVENSLFSNSEERTFDNRQTVIDGDETTYNWRNVVNEGGYSDCRSYIDSEEFADNRAWIHRSENESLHTCNYEETSFSCDTANIFNEGDDFRSEACYSHFYDYNQSRVYDESRNYADFSRSFAEYGGDAFTVNNGGDNRAVTVNFNAYNEFRSGAAGADVDSVMSEFCGRLAEAVSLAAEGVRF